MRVCVLAFEMLETVNIFSITSIENNPKILLKRMVTLQDFTQKDSKFKTWKPLDEYYSTTGKYYSLAFIWKVSLLKNSIHRLKS